MDVLITSTDTVIDSATCPKPGTMMYSSPAERRDNKDGSLQLETVHNITGVKMGEMSTDVPP